MNKQPETITVPLDDSSVSADLLDDKDVARVLNFSPSWVRQQRRHRRLGLKHVLTLDPIMVGDRPRYDPDELGEFLRRLKSMDR